MSNYEQGFRAAGNGEMLDNCPFTDILARMEWTNGWREFYHAMQFCGLIRRN